MLEDSVTAFVRSDPERARRHRGCHPSYDPVAWKEIAEQGWLSILVPEEAGGLGLGIKPLTVVARAFGRAALPEPLVAAGTAPVICLAGAQGDVWRDRLQAVMAGELIASLAWQGPAGSADIEEGAVKASGGDAFTLDGVARFAAPSSAHAFIVYAAGSEPGLYWVSRAAPGLQIDAEECADGSSLARLSLTGVSVDRADRVAGGAEAKKMVRDAIDVALLANAAELLGVMDGAFDLTLEYLRTRQQFGVAIGSYQALQHRAVDIWIQKQLTEEAVNEAASIFDDPALVSRRSAAAAGAKARAAREAVALCNQALQMHGAIGFADEYGLGILLNRAITLAAWQGNGAQHCARFGALSPLDVRSSGTLERAV